MRFYRSGRRSHRASDRKIAPWVVILICVGAAFLITVIVGNILGDRLDKASYDRLNGKETGEQATPQKPQPTAPVVRAHPYTFGENLAGVLEHPQVSLSLNTPDGKSTYMSDVIDFFDRPLHKSTPLSDGMRELLQAASYVSGVYHVSAFSTDSAELLYAQAAADGAILREFVEAGGTETLVCGIPFADADTAAILSYLSEIKRAVGDSPLGVAIPLSVAQGRDAWELFDALSDACDFLVLDMRGQTVPLSDANFYLSQYGMRLLIEQAQSDYVDLAAENLKNYQIATSFD